ncbi:MAG: purine-nucleoside phosphorylase, partial [Bacteroidota bacterium]
GVERLLVTNAAGGINPRFVPGTLMLLTDHLNWTHTAPPLAVTGWAAQARPAPSPYDPVWRAQVQELALAEGIAVEQGSYVWVLGPSYETKAEIRAFARLGADAVGMSTVPEVLMAHRLGMRVLALSTITNPAAGLSPVPLSHDEVLEVGHQVRTTLERLIRGIVYSARSC